MKNVEQLALESAMIDSFNRYAQGLDTKDWDMVLSCFADNIFIDYGPVIDPAGNVDVPRSSASWIEIMRGNIGGFDFTRHTITNHRCTINENELSCKAYLIADHVIFPDQTMPAISAKDVVTFVGEYTNRYQKTSEGLKITHSKLDMHWCNGPLELFAEAQQRWAQT